MTYPHFLTIYNKPREQLSQGRLVRRRYLAYNYGHTISAIGGFDKASCNLNVDRVEAENIYFNYVGNDVAVHVDNPLEPIFEGYINRVTIEAGDIRTSRGLDEMANNTYVVYADGTAAPRTKVTLATTNTTSGATFGFKSKMIEIGEQYTNGAGIATAMRNKYLARYSYPSISTVQAGGQGFSVSIEIYGYYHTWSWDVFGSTNTTLIAAGDAVFLYTFNTTPPSIASMTGLNSSNYANNGNGVFYNDRDFTLWSSNGGFTITLEKRVGETHWQKMLNIVEAGDGVNDWVIGITGTDPNLGYRRAYYRQASTTLKYVTTAYGDRRFYTTYGQLVPLWYIRPDASVLIRDLSSTFSGTGDDPRVAYIHSVDYDAEAQKISWATRDNLTLGGFYQYAHQNKETGRAFGAEQRQYFL